MRTAAAGPGIRLPSFVQSKLGWGLVWAFPERPALGREASMTPLGRGVGLQAVWAAGPKWAGCGIGSQDVRFDRTRSQSIAEFDCVRAHSVRGPNVTARLDWPLSVSSVCLQESQPPSPLGLWGHPPEPVQT